MISIINYEEKYFEDCYLLYKDFRDEEDFFLVLSKEEFKNHLFGPRFQKDACFLAVEDGKVLGIAAGNLRESDEGNPNASGFIHTFIVKKERRRQGIGSMLLEALEAYFKAHGRASSRFVFLGSTNWPWYIPNTDHHMHPGMPCVRINSEFYIFLYHHDYFVNSIHEGFHLPLSQYEFNDDVKKRMDENAKIGLTVELYDPKKHYGIEEFCEKIEKDGNGGFAHSIRYNLGRDVPRPFLVASDHGKVCGWTGAMYVEETGRGHLDGIIVDPDYRKHGLGKALFCNLCKYLKEMGSTYMTFFTGLDNPARYIYMYAGFRVAQSFADMKKNL